MKINIELELHPNTERPERKTGKLEDLVILVLCRKRNFCGELIYSKAWSTKDGYGQDECAKNDEGYFEIPWYEIDGWISVSELKEQVMKASGR